MSAGGGAARGMAVVVGCGTSGGSAGSGRPSASSAAPVLRVTAIADGAEGGAECGHAVARPAVPMPSMGCLGGDCLPMAVDTSARTGPPANLALLVYIAVVGLADLGGIWMHCWKQGSWRRYSWALRRAFCLLARVVVFSAGVLDRDQPEDVEQMWVLMAD